MQITEVDMTHMFPPVNVTEDDFVFTETPTMDMIKQAAADLKIVVALYDESKYGSYDLLLFQYLKDYDLEPSDYCTMFPIFAGQSFDDAKQNWIELYLEAYNATVAPWFAPAGFKRGELTCVSLSPVAEQ